MACAHEAEPSRVRNLSVDQGDEACRVAIRGQVTQCSRLAEARVYLFEKAGGDLSVQVHLVQRPGMKGLVQQQRPGGVGEIVSRDVGDQDSALAFQPLKRLRYASPVPGRERAPDARIQVKAVLEIDVGDEISACNAIQGNGEAIYVNPRQVGNGSRRGHETLGQVLRAPPQFFSEIKDRIFHFCYSSTDGEPGKAAGAQLDSSRARHENL